MKLLRDHEGRAIRLTDERLAHILEHPEMRGMEARIEETVRHPEKVDEKGNVLGFSVMRVSALHDAPLEVALQRRAIARFHSDAEFTMRSGAPHWYRRIYDHRLRTANDRELRRWLADPGYDSVQQVRHRHSANWSWW